MDGKVGLNVADQPDTLDPRQVAQADNVIVDERSFSKRRAYAELLTGSVDAVIRGGVPGTSYRVVGDQRRLSDGTLTDSDATDVFRRDPEYHHRHGFILIPELALTGMRLNVRAGDPGWILEICVQTPDVFYGTENPDALPDSGTTAHNTIPPVLLSKCGPSSGGTIQRQWEVRVVPPATDDLTGKPYVVLRLYQTNFQTNVSEHAYELAGVPSSFIEPGKRYWFAWKFVDATALIHSYYWKEGDTFAVVSTDAIPAGLRGAGTGTFDFPVMLGGTAKRKRRDPAVGTGERTMLTERGFNGLISEYRFWQDTVVSHPDWTTTPWFFESEIPEERLLRSNDTWIDTTLDDIRLYYRVSPQNVDPTDARFLLPIAGHSASGFRANKAWLTGADASWVTQAGSTKLGTRALAFMPGIATVADAYLHGPTWFQDSFTGPGIRVPNPELYWKRLATHELYEGTTNEYREFTFRDQFSVRITFRADGFTNATDPSITRAYLFHMVSTYRVAGQPDAYKSEVNEAITVYLLRSGAVHTLVADINFQTGTSFYTLTGTPGVGFVAGQDYTLVLSIAYNDHSGGTISDAKSFRGRLWLDGVLLDQEENATVNRQKPTPSVNLHTDTSGTNNNIFDHRAQVFGMAIGNGIEDLELGGNLGGISSIGGQGKGCYWGFHHNESPHLPNDGTMRWTAFPFRGRIGEVQIWEKELTIAEVLAYVSRGPNETESAQYGALLLSNWKFDEGKGATLFDTGYLGNHVPFNPYPRVEVGAGSVARRKKSTIRGFWEFRSKTPREGVDGRDIYVLTEGCVSRLSESSLGLPYLLPIAHGLRNPLNVLPSAFQASDFVYVVPGSGPVIRISKSHVTNAGISPVYGQPQGGDYSFLESHRDGTFLTQEGTASATVSPFEQGKKFQWVCTYYDEASGLESRPSRIMAWTIEAGIAPNIYVDKVTLVFLPIPREPNVTHRRIYRTAPNGGVFRFVDQIPISAKSYVDAKETDDTGLVISSALNSPPPLDLELGIAHNGRAYYAKGATLHYSIRDFPEAVPDPYQITLLDSKNNRITGMVGFQDRTLVFQQDTTFAAFDTGGEVTLDGISGPPVSIAKLTDDAGCVSHHGIVVIDGVGVVFPGERGIYVSDGTSVQYVSRDIEPLYDSLDKTTYRTWHAVHMRRRDSYWLFVGGDLVIGWNYRTSGFYLLKNVPAAFSRIIEDTDTGLNRLYIADRLGGLYEMDSPDDPTDADAIGDRLGTLQLSGDVFGVDVDPPRQSIQLFSGPTLPTAGDGCRGVELEINGETRRILSNTSTKVFVETPFTATINIGDDWRMGVITSDWRSGLLDAGSKYLRKKWQYAQINFADLDRDLDDSDELRAEMMFESESPGDPENQFTVTPSSDEVVVGPRLGRGTNLQLRLFEQDGNRPGRANNPWEVTDYQFGYKPEGRVSWST